MRKGVGSGVGYGSGSISHRYGSGDPDPHKNVTDPQYWLKDTGGWLIGNCIDGWLQKGLWLSREKAGD
jgi:hypothetical protein